ncbi:MAG: hypothetical protein GY865_09285 [candidate division Zixibacteria bacterium]|nr:hypothetical protein [candidate division Zixibacteria bacterium]
MKRNIQTFIRDYPLFAILIFAGIVRGIFLLYYYYDEQWDHLLVDSLFHNYWALSIADGDILGQEPFFRAPLYIYLLGGLYSIFGGSILIARIFGFIIGILSVYITGQIAFKLFGKISAILAALIHAIYPIAIYFESELLVDSLFTFLFELSILCLLKTIETKALKWYGLTGLIIGLAALTKPTILALLPVYIIWIFINTKNLKQSLLHSIILIGSLILIILPVTVRNLIVADDFVLISSSGGINFYIGNNASADGSTASMPSPLGHNWQIKDINYIAENESNRELKASEISNFWFNKSFDWIIDNKIEFFKLYLYKLGLSFNNLEISNNRDLNIFFNNNPVLRLNPINFAFILALVSISIFFLRINRKWNRQILFVIIMITLYLLLISLFFINARYRLPVIPLLIILASYGLSNLLSIDFISKFLKQHMITLVIGVGVFLVSFIPSPKTESKNIGGGLFNQANFNLYQGNYKTATDLYNQLLNSNPSFPDANLNLGVTWLRQGIGDSAEQYFSNEIKLFPKRPDGYVNIASLRLLNNEYLESIIYADSALALKPYHSQANIIKIRCHAALSDTLGLQNSIEEALLLVPDRSRIHLEAGFIYSNWQMDNLSIEHLLQVLSTHSIAAETDDRAFTYSGLTGRQISLKTKGQAAYQLGYIYGKQNDLKNSIRLSKLAIVNDSSLTDAYINLINGYRLSGQIDSAKHISQIALNKFPNNKTLQSITSILK